MHQNLEDIEPDEHIAIQEGGYPPIMRAGIIPNEEIDEAPRRFNLEEITSGQVTQYQ